VRDSDRDRFVRLVTVLSLHLAKGRLRAAQRKKLDAFRQEVSEQTLARIRRQLAHVNRLMAKRTAA
jgi:hypothetical protein